MNFEYLNGLYFQKNCEYFASELKKAWSEVPHQEVDEYVAKLADCAAERGQFEFAESLIKNLDKKNYKSSILSQAKAKIDLSRNDYKRITDDYELKKPHKATFQYYIYVAQSYYEQKDYDSSLKVLSYISPNRITPFQKNTIRYWKAKNYFLKDENEKTLYFLDLILEDDDENGWLKEAAQILKNNVVAKYRPFRAVLYISGTYDTNTNKQSVVDTISEKENRESYIVDGTYRVNPSFDFYILKNRNKKKFFNVDLSFAWSSEQTSNQSQTYTIKYRSSNKTDSRNTLSWDLGTSKSQSKFKDSSNDAFVRFGLFHLINDNKFATATYRFNRNLEFGHKTGHTISLSLFSVLDKQLVYGTLSQSQVLDHAANYEYDGSSAPIPAYGTVFGNYGVTTLDLAHSIDFTDQHSLRTQLSYANTVYQTENLPAGSEIYTNSLKKRSDQTYSASLIYANRWNERTNVELFATAIQGTSAGHQGYDYGTGFTNKNYSATQLGINLDWTYE